MISYAGVSLTLPDEDALRRAAAYLDPTGFGDEAPFNWGDVADWPRINVLRWPRAASKPATGVFLATAAQAEQVRQQARLRPGQPLTLRIDDGTRHIEAQMHLLAPRPLARTGTHDWWLLYLADDRWFWPSRPCQAVVSAGVTTWAEHFAALAEDLGVTLTLDALPAIYSTPPASQTLRLGDDPAAALDRAAAAVGACVVLSLAGEVHIQRPIPALARHELNLLSASRLAGGEAALKQLAGGPDDRPLAVPAALDIVFVDADGPVAERVTLAEADPPGWRALPWAPTGVEVIRTTGSLGGELLLDFVFEDGSSASSEWSGSLLEDFGAEDGSDLGAEADGSDARTLAVQIARDWYGWRLGRARLALIGAAPWVPEGMAEVEWEQGPEYILCRADSSPTPAPDALSLVGPGGSVDYHFTDVTVAFTDAEVIYQGDTVNKYYDYTQLDFYDDVEVNYYDGVDITYQDFVTLVFKDETDITYQGDVNITYQENVVIIYQGDTNITYKEDVVIIYEGDTNITYQENVVIVYEGDTNITYQENVEINYVGPNVVVNYGDVTLNFTDTDLVINNNTDITVNNGGDIIIQGCGSLKFGTDGHFVELLTVILGPDIDVDLDYLLIYDGSTTIHKRVNPTNVFKLINVFPNLAAPPDQDDDYFVVYDASATTPKKVTPQKVWDGLDDLADLAAEPDAADYLLVYDDSAGVAKKVAYDQLGGMPDTPPTVVAPSAVPTWFLAATITHADLTDPTPGASQEVTAYTLPAKAGLHAGLVRTKTAGSGGGVSSLTMNLKVGGNSWSAGGGDGLVVNNISTQGRVEAIPGSGPVQSWTGTTAVGLHFAIDGGTALLDLTAGEWEVYLLLSTLG